MKLAKLSVLTLLIILITSMLTAQELDVSGHWEGVVSYEKEHLVIKFDFFKYSNSLVGACRIPEWEPDILGTSPLKVEGKKVSFQLSGFGSVILQYDDKFHRLRGQSVNRDGVFNFQLSKVILPAEKLYYNKTFNVPSAGGAILKAEFIMPEKQGKHPVVIFFGDRDEGSRHAQRGRALMLARRGIAALIFDRRGEGNSSEDAKNVLFKDLVADGVAIADFTSRLENVDPAQVGIMGFGAGANITPFIAAQSTNVAFIVNVGGSSMDTWQRRWYALENLMNNSEEKFGDRDYVEAKMYMDLLNNFAKTRKGWPELVKNMEQSQRKKWAALVRFPNNPNSDEFSWLFRFQNDPSASLKTIKIPFLAIYGEKNKNLAYKADSQKLNSLMTEAANPDFQLALLPGADHRMFIHIDGKDKDGKGGFRWRRVAPGFNQLLLGWLDKHVSKVK